MPLHVRGRVNRRMAFATIFGDDDEPTTFTDDFERADGTLANGWVGSTWSVVSGTAVNTPTVSSELFTNVGFETYTGTIDDATADTFTGWGAVSGAPNILATSDAHSGSAALLMTNAGVGSPSLAQTATGTAGEWYRGSIWIKRSGSAAPRFALTNGLSGNYDISNTTYEEKVITSRNTAANLTMLITHRTDAAGNLIADDASLKQLTLSSLMATKSVPFVPRRILASVTYVSITHAGVVHYADDNNFVVAYILEGNFGAKSVFLDKRVSGTPTTVASASITYSAGAPLELDYDPSAQTYTVKYNGSTAISAQSVTDSVFQTAKKVGMFSTYEGNSLDDFATYQVAA